MFRPNDSRHGRLDRVMAIVSVILAAGFVATLPSPGESEPTAGSLSGKSATGDLAPTDAVAPAHSPSIRFPHEKHSDLTCTGCHSGASKSRSAADDLGPSMSDCAECHGPENGEKEGPKPRLRNCKGCHIGFDRTVDQKIEKPEDWKSVRPAPMVPPRPAAHIPFDHRDHLRRLKQEADQDDIDALCARCHTNKGDEAQIPTLTQCRECHGEETGRLKPDNHTVDWEKRHANVARANPTSCESCHTEDDCGDCHNDEAAKPFSVHPPNFDTLHAVDARARLDDCSDCHTVETFCRRCHASAKFVPDPPDNPPARFDMHPPNWTKPGAPRNHAVMARRNIEDCASCHTEQDCVTCHQGVNPHPPEFQLQCRQWLEANPTPCAKCHTDLGLLRTKCL